MADKKKIAFYTYLAHGHINLCSTIGKVLLNNYSNLEIYFIVTQEWANKLSKIDNRFKFGIIEIIEKDRESRVGKVINTIGSALKNSSEVEILAKWWQLFYEDDLGIAELDRKSEEALKIINPDFVLVDMCFHMPAAQSFKYGFINSCNPLNFNFDGFPSVASTIGVGETDKIKKFAEEYEPYRTQILNQIKKIYKHRNVELPKDIELDQPFSKKHFSIYSYPAEIDYYPEELKEKYNLWQVDTCLLPDRIPKPFELPEDFKALPGKLVYVSLGSLFSVYVDQLERLVKILDKVPNAKFIVSKGPNGDKLKFPSNKFIGENFVDQLGILQIADLAIVHGGNNTFTESFYFGVPQIVGPVLYDQFPNKKRIIETEYGYGFDLMNYKEEELLSTVDKALNNEELKSKLVKLGDRIRKDNRLDKVATKIMNYINKL